MHGERWEEWKWGGAVRYCKRYHGMLYLGCAIANGLMSVGQASVYGILFAICSLSISIEASVQHMQRYISSRIAMADELLTLARGTGSNKQIRRRHHYEQY